MSETKFHALSGVYAYLAVITLIGGLLRFTQLGEPLWIDEALYALGYISPTQEQIPLLFNFLPDTEFWIRFPFALAGSLLAPLAFLAYMKYGNDAYVGLGLALFVAVFPYFVFHSTIARPYMMGAMFMALGWVWRPAYILGMLCTPFAIFGLHWKDWRWGIACAVTALVLLAIRQDQDRDFLNFAFLTNGIRIYAPLLVGICLHICVYLLPHFEFRRTDADMVRG